MSSLPLPLPETRAQVAARFASACLVVPLDMLLPPGRSQPLPSPSPLVAFAAVRSIERLPLLGGEARRRSCPRPGRRCAASCWIVVSSIAPCRRLIPLGRSFLAGFINEVLAKGNVAGNASLRQWKAIPYLLTSRATCYLTALLISSLNGVHPPRAGTVRGSCRQAGAPWLCGWGSRHEGHPGGARPACVKERCQKC